VNATAQAGSESTALGGEADPFAARWIDAIAVVPKRKTKQKATNWR
jgi:hypothetical protein